MLTHFHESQEHGSPNEPVVEFNGTDGRLYFMSRDRRLLAAFISVILLVAAGLAWVLRGADYVASPPQNPAQGIQALLAAPSADTGPLVKSILSLNAAPSENLISEIADSRLPDKSKELATAVCESLRSVPAEPTSELLIHAYQVNPLQGANEAIGDMYAQAGKANRAREYYHRELERNPSDELRAKLVGLLERHGEFAALASLAGDPDFAPHFSIELRLKLALHQRQWSEVAARIAEMQLGSISALPLILALAAGFAWLVVGLHCGQPQAWVCYRTIVPLTAVCVGAVGALGVHFIAAWQDSWLAVGKTGEFLPDFAYFAGIVASREEILKLLLLIPFLPTMLRRRDPLEILIVCGSVGLGFAFEGNLQLCRTAALEEAFGRLLTANFFHFATTALAGAALCRLLIAGSSQLPRFLRTLATVIIAHGAYDGFSRIESVGMLSWISVASVLVISKLFFIELRSWRDRFTDQCFLGATLVICLSGLAATVLVTASVHAGFNLALWALLKNAAYLILTGFVFFLRFDHDLALEPTEPATNS